MYILKGFIAFPTMTNNAVGEVAKLGELSKDSLTYAKETGLYKHSDYEATLFHSFFSQDSREGQIEVPREYWTMALRMGRFVYEQAWNGRFSSNRTQVIYALEAEYEDILEQVEIGAMVTDGELWMPEWVSYQHPDTQNFIRIWFSDTSFSAQYDSYEYIFIPPVPNIDDLFMDRQRVVNMLAENNVKRIVGKIDEVRGDYPYTLLRTEEYEWEGGGEALRTDWTVMIYGRYGNDPDKIRLALIDWVLENSDRSRNEWLELFPDIFTPTEFIITPLWHQFAIPNQTIQSGFNSPVISISRAIEVAQLMATGIGYEKEDLMDNTVLARTPTRTLGLLITGSSANRNGITNFLQLYPDYIGMPTSSRDFGRLSSRTQEWSYMLLDLLQTAESMTEFTIIPPGYSRIVRNDIVYAVKDYEGMEYLMATRLSTIKALGIEGPYEPEFDWDADPENTLSVEARMVREHLMYEANPHYTDHSHLGLADVANTDFLTVDDSRFNVESRLNTFYEFQRHMTTYQDPHAVTKGHVGLGDVANLEYFTVSGSDLEANLALNRF